MKSLFLVRHAHAGESHDDHERALSTRGAQAAVEAGKYLARVHCAPQMALLSTALRVIQTWQKIQAELSHSPRVEAERSLYLAGVDAMHDQLQSIPESIECALLVAHNPGISQLATWLTASGTGKLIERLEHGFPPAAVAMLALDVTEWADTRERCAEIVGFWEG